MITIGIITRNVHGWATTQLSRAIIERGYQPFPMNYRSLYTEISDFGYKVYSGKINLVEKLLALIVRPLGRLSFEQAFFRMDTLHLLEESGVPVINSPKAIEVAINKHRSLALLARHGLKVPYTVVTENINEAVGRLNYEKGVVVKPLFGSKGLGSTLIKDKDFAWRIYADLRFMKHVLYIQEYIEHGGRDIRAFVIGNQVVAAMYRERPGFWKTNISRGAKPVPYKPTADVEELAIRAAKILGCDIAGVDILDVKGEKFIIEVNSQPGWKGIQTVTKVDIAKKIIDYIISEKIKR